MAFRNLFGGSEGGFMDVIRCDEQEYLVYKWSPGGNAGSSNKENAIRYGSRLRVKEGEVAVFVYPQPNGASYDFIQGPADETIKTANFPVLANIVGLAYGGNSPFMAEVYFINLSGNMQLNFGIPYFDMFDPRFTDLGVPCAIRGTITFNITDYENFIRLNRLRNLTHEDLKHQVKDFFIRKAKATVLNIPDEHGIAVMQIEKKLDTINTIIHDGVKEVFAADFGINLKRTDISTIELNKEHPHYLQLKHATADQQTKTIGAKTDIEITNLGENARITRKDSEMGVEGRNFAVHQINTQAGVLKTAAENLGGMGNIDFGDGGGMNPIGIMTGIGIGRVMGSQIGNMAGGINNVPPPVPEVAYHIAINGQQSGPYTISQLKILATNNQFTKDYYIWKAGMAGWEPAYSVPDVSAVFAAVMMPPPPPAPTL